MTDFGIFLTTVKAPIKVLFYIALGHLEPHLSSLLQPARQCPLSAWPVQLCIRGKLISLTLSLSLSGGVSNPWKRTREDSGDFFEKL